MKRIVLSRANAPITGEIDNLASDKSISHRAAMFALLAGGRSTVRNFLYAEDTLCSLSIAEQLGLQVERAGDTLLLTPPAKISEPSRVLDCGNAGTAMRLYAGLLAAQEGFFVLSGDRYLNARPMRRVIAPLRSIGAHIDGQKEGAYAPFAVRGSVLKPFDFHSQISSAQVKSALLLAGLFAQGDSSFSEPELSRDHTERMLAAMGAEITAAAEGGGKIALKPLTRPLEPLNITINADPSSGFFFAVAAAIVRGSDILLKNISLNPTRIEA